MTLLMRRRFLGMLMVKKTMFLMMLMVEDDHVDDFDAVSNEEDRSLLFFLKWDNTPLPNR